MSSKDGAHRKSRSPAALVSAGVSEQPVKIGEAARMLGVEAYVLRFWETQFPFLRPKHSRSKHRFYDQQDLATLRLIKRLLHSEGYTIVGAKRRIREVGLENLLNETRAAEARPSDDLEENLPAGRREDLQHTLVEIREDLKSLQRLLAH